MTEETLFASEGAFILLTFIPIIIYLFLTGLGIYFVIKMLKFMNEKAQLDRERNQKLDELIRVMGQDDK